MFSSFFAAPALLLPLLGPAPAPAPAGRCLLDPEWEAMLTSFCDLRSRKNEDAGKKKLCCEMRRAMLWSCAVIGRLRKK